MSLPDLPRTVKRRESDFSLIFRKWWEKNPLPGEIELKDTRGRDSILFSEFSEDQEVIATMATGKKGVLVRRTVGTVGGADYSGLVNSPYWIVVRYPRSFEVISVGTWALEKRRSCRKSLTAARAREISVVSVPLK